MAIVRPALRGVLSRGGGGAVSPGKTGLVSWWSMDEAAGTRADSHGTSDLTNTTGTGSPSQTTGVVDEAVRWNTTTSKRLYDQTGIDVSAFTDGITVGGWVKQTSGDLATSLLYVLSQSDGGTNNSSFTLSSRGWSISTDGINTINVSGGPASADWAFVVGVWDRSTGVASFYRNGSFVDSETAFTTALYFTSSLDYNATACFGLSRGFSTGGGDLDEVFMYSRPLSEAEISWLYNAGAGRAYSEL